MLTQNRGFPSIVQPQDEYPDLFCAKEAVKHGAEQHSHGVPAITFAGKCILGLPCPTLPGCLPELTLFARVIH
jgi:hypothetical protein